MVDLAVSLCARVNLEWVKAGGFQDIVFVGHSLGGMVVRQAYLLSRGAQPKVCPAFDWSARVSRIVLFAALNRGATPEASVGIRLATWLAGLVPSVNRFLGFQLLRGSDFVTNLRIQWIQHFDALGERAPAVVQLRGDGDRYVGADDSLDVEQCRRAWQVIVPDAGHGDVHGVEGVPDPEGRYALIREALLGEVPEVAAQSRVRGADVYAFVLHGIRASNRTWVTELAAKLKGRLPGERAVQTVISTYGYLSALRFAIPQTRWARLQWFQDQYSACLAENHHAEFLFVGHSNGTYLLGESLRRIPGMRFKRVVLAGSVLPPDYPWSELLKSGQVEAVRNHRSRADVPVAILCSALRGLGMKSVGTGGFEGFADAREPVREVYWYDGGHSRAIQEDNYDTLVEFAATGNDPECALVDRARDPGGIARFSRIARLLALPIVLLWLLGAAWFLFRSGSWPAIAYWSTTAAVLVTLEFL